MFANGFFDHIMNWMNQKRLHFHNKMKKTEDVLRMEWQREPGARWDHRWEIEVWAPQKGMGVRKFLQEIGLTTEKSSGNGYNPRAVEKMLEKWNKKVAGVKTEDTTAITI